MPYRTFKQVSASSIRLSSSRSLSLHTFLPLPAALLHLFCSTVALHLHLLPVFSSPPPLPSHHILLSLLSLLPFLYPSLSSYYSPSPSSSYQPRSFSSSSLRFFHTTPSASCSLSRPTPPACSATTLPPCAPSYKPSSTRRALPLRLALLLLDPLTPSKDCPAPSPSTSCPPPPSSNSSAATPTRCSSYVPIFV